MDWQTHKKKYLIGFITGCVFASFSLWFVLIKTPSLSNPLAQGSYALGQQMGRNFKRQKVEINERVFLAALQDAKKDQSDLNEETMRKGLDHIHRSSAEARKKDPAPAALNASTESVSSNGFKISQFGFKYKIENENNPKDPRDPRFRKERFDRQDQGPENLDNEPGGRSDTSAENPRLPNPTDKLRFHLKITDSRSEVLFDSEKKGKALTFEARELPSTMQMALSMIQSQQKIIIQISDQDSNLIRNLLKISAPPQPDLTYELLRLK